MHVGDGAMKEMQMKAITGLLMTALTAMAAEPVAPEAPGAYEGPPKIEMVRDAFVTFADGTYYLTGTAGTYDKSGNVDYQYNRGGPLFKSEDLVNWESLGYAWDRVVLYQKSRKPGIGFWLDWQAPSERIDALLALATTTPKIYRIDDAWYMLCAMNDQAVLMQKSVSGKPEGPYEDFTVYATRGGYPSLFTDDYGSRYLLFADGWIAKITPDLKTLAEEIRPLSIAPAGSPADSRMTIGGRGVCLFKNGGTYYAFAPQWRESGGKPSMDAVLWTANNVYGPYTETKTALQGAGRVTVFKAGSQWKAVAGMLKDGAPQILDIQLP
jgi:hypothetical protein